MGILDGATPRKWRGTAYLGRAEMEPRRQGQRAGPDCPSIPEGPSALASQGPSRRFRRSRHAARARRKCCVGILEQGQRTFKGRKATVENQLEIAKLALGQDNGCQGLGLGEELSVAGGIAGEQVLEDATMRRVGHCMCGWCRLEAGGLLVDDAECGVRAGVEVSLGLQ